MVKYLVGLILMLGLIGCTAESDATQPSGPSAGLEQPEQAVTGLLAALAAEEYGEAVDLTVDGQMVVVALVEGATVDEAKLVAGQPKAVGANFWRGFEAGLDRYLGVGAGEIVIGEVTEFEAGGARFARVAVRPDSGDRFMVVKQDNGWKVDVVATFAPALASKLGGSATSLRADPDAAALLAVMTAQRPSLEAALTAPDLTPELDQAIRSAILALAG